jgi:vacuolar-type H+-ATPase subunit I/STV1
MKTFDRVLAWALLVFGCLHTAGSVVLMSRTLNLDSAWFFSGGLAVIFGAFLNLIRTYRPTDSAIARASALANLLLLILAGLLCWVLRHDLKTNPQAAVFVPLVALELLFSVRQWLR